MRLINLLLLTLVVLGADASASLLFQSATSECEYGSQINEGNGSCLAEEGDLFAAADGLTDPVEYGDLGVFTLAEVEGDEGYAFVEASAGFEDFLTVHSGMAAGSTGIIELIATVGLLNPYDLTSAIELNGVFTDISEFDTVISVMAPFVFGEEFSFSVLLEVFSEAGCLGCPALDLRLATFKADLFRVYDTAGNQLRDFDLVAESGTNYEIEYAAVPEPATWFLFSAGMGLMAGAQRLRRRT